MGRRAADCFVTRAAQHASQVCVWTSRGIVEWDVQRTALGPPQVESDPCLLLLVAAKDMSTISGKRKGHACLGARDWRCFLVIVGVMILCTTAEGRPFTVAVDIGIKSFANSCAANRERVVFSPNHAYFFVYTERGRLDINRPEDSIRVYRVTDIQRYLNVPTEIAAPTPMWVIRRSTDEEGPIISECRWLANSEGIAFLQRLPGGIRQLSLADLASRKAIWLTSPEQDVTDFDIRDATHFVYAIADLEPRERTLAERTALAVPADGRNIDSLLFPESAQLALLSNRRYLWAVMGGSPFEVRVDSQRVALLHSGLTSLALAPQGDEVIAAVPVQDVPPDWGVRFPPPIPGSTSGIQVGPQDPQSLKSAQRYVRINLDLATEIALTAGPTGNSAGWYSAAGPNWSSDGTQIVLADAYPSTGGANPQRPCVVVIDLSSHSQSCVQPLYAPAENESETGYFIPFSVRYIGRTAHRIRMIVWDRSTGEDRTIEYEQTTAGGWTKEKNASADGSNALEVIVDEDFNRPPHLVAKNARTARILWDPNPQLADVDVGDASVYEWQDSSGRKWRGGLYKPAGFEADEHYPLIIQTHGFQHSQFIPSGMYNTAFAARELAASGFLVLQVDEHVCPSLTPEEGSCAALGYDAAVKQLAAEGTVDPRHVGIIGFSRTCFYVMEALAHGTTRYEAASVTDGVLLSYLQYLLDIDADGNITAKEAEQIIGGPPFGEGLIKWFHNSPMFALDRTSAAVLLIGLGRPSLLDMWEPYARLRYLGMPTDLIMLRSNEHVLTNPKVRLASQGGTVDWFRFWLKGEEDPSPKKSEQYQRWRKLRDLPEKQSIQ